MSHHALAARAAILIAVLALAACSSSATPTATSGPGGGGNPTTGIGNPTPGGGGGGGTSAGCAGRPTFSLATDAPTFAPDAALLAKYPQQIDGQPITNAQSGFFIDLVCLGGGAGVDQMGQAFAAIGYDLSTLSLGSFDATVDGSGVSVSAIRTPGKDAILIIQNASTFALALGGTNPLSGTMSQASIGGKTVNVVTNTDGSKDYYYASGDVLFGVTDTITDSQATKIFSALP